MCVCARGHVWVCVYVSEGSCGSLAHSARVINWGEEHATPPVGPTCVCVYVTLLPNCLLWNCFRFTAVRKSVSFSIQYFYNVILSLCVTVCFADAYTNVHLETAQHN